MPRESRVSASGLVSPASSEREPNPLALGDNNMNTTASDSKKVLLGRTLITPGAQDSIPKEDVVAALGRHARGDWGEVSPDDREENELSLVEGFRLLSAYTSSNGVRFWVITEADRSATTVLLPEEY